MPATTDGGLAGFGLRTGQRVRFRPAGGGRWREGRAVGVERDGSIGVTDARGLARAIPVERIEVRTAGRRGAAKWEAMADIAARTEQLGLF